MMENKIICIGREFGSGGHEIAVRTGPGWISGCMKRTFFVWRAGTESFPRK